MNQYDLNGRVALITGGGSGLGRGIGQALAELGAIVVAADIQTEPLRRPPAHCVSRAIRPWR